MTTIQEKINFFKTNLDTFEDDMDKYKYLLDQAKNKKTFPIREFANNKKSS